TSVDFVDHRITVIRRKGHDPNTLIPGMDIQQLSFPQGDALDDELKAFVQSVRNRKPPQVDGRVGRDALRIALDVMAQINSKIDRYLNHQHP
ncbi:MAG: gfo/Idh/MocA family oxidoreductase, partial [Desulfobacterales bacterium]